MAVDPIGKYAKVGVVQGHDGLLRRFLSSRHENAAGKTCVGVAGKIESLERGEASAKLTHRLAV